MRIPARDEHTQAPRTRARVAGVRAPGTSSRLRPRRRALVTLASLLAIVAAAIGGVAQGAPSTAASTVAVTVTSATTLNAAGCATGVLNTTDFGTVFPATSNVTSADCAVVFGSSNDTAMLRVGQSDATGSALIGMPNGNLDTTFDTDGITTTAVGASSDYGREAVIQPDSKIVVAGYAAMANNDFAVVRYNSNGSLDATFDTDGKVTTAIGAGNDSGEAVALQTDGKIVVAGASFVGGSWDFAVTRYTTTGALDATFDTDGMVTTPVLAAGDWGAAVAVQGDGKIVVAGRANNGANDDFALVRYNSNGSLDATFDGDGKVTTAINGSTDTATSIVIQPDGKLIAVGSSQNGAYSEFGLARYNTDGSLDTSFDTDGKVSTDVAAEQDVPWGPALQPDGKLVVAGFSTVAANDDFTVVRYTTAGALDATWDGDGKVVTPLGGASEQGHTPIVQPDGRVLVAGRINAGGWDYVAARYTSAGALDTSFSGDGWMSFDVGGANDNLDGAAMQPDGKVVMTGSTFGATWDIATARLDAGAVADWSGSWAASNLFAACLHTVSSATATWTLAGAGNCTTAINANWNALPVTPSKVASSTSGVTNATTNLRFGFKASSNQAAGTYAAPLTFEVLAPNA